MRRRRGGVAKRRVSGGTSLGCENQMEKLRKVLAYGAGAHRPAWIFECADCGAIHQIAGYGGYRNSVCAQNAEPFELVYAGLAKEGLLIRAYGKQYKKIIAALIIHDIETWWRLNEEFKT